MMISKDLVIKTARKIIELFPRRHSDTDPFKVLISTVLSQRTRDENTEVSTKELFSKFKSPWELSKADPHDIYHLIRAAGMYRQKAQRIIKISKILVKEYDGRVPSNLSDLLKLPGVGRKTANIVLFVGFGIPALAVDTHVHRISNRLGWIKTTTPEATEKELTKILPKDLWGPINGSMVEFGRKICKPINPLCQKCPIFEFCEYFKEKR